MKKINYLLVLVAMMATTTVFAQQKGQIWMDGDVNFGMTKTSVGDNDVKANNFGIEASVNYMLDNHWSIGIGVGFDMAKDEAGLTEIFGADIEKYSAFHFQVQGTYFLRLSKLFTWTPRAYFRGAFGSYDYMVAGDDDVTQFGVVVEPIAFQINVSKHFAFTAACDLANIGFMTTSIDEADVTVTDFDVKLGKNTSTVGDLGLRLGFRYFF